MEGNVRLYGERRRGVVGADRETGTQDTRENSSVDEGTISRAKPTRRVEGLMSIADRKNREGSRASGGGMHLAVCPVMPAGETTESRPPRGAVSFCPSTHTHTQATYHQTYRSGGGRGASLHIGRWVGKLGKEIGRPEPEGW